MRRCEGVHVSYRNRSTTIQTIYNEAGCVGRNLERQALSRFLMKCKRARKCQPLHFVVAGAKASSGCSS